MLVNKLTDTHHLNQDQALRSVGLVRSTYHYRSSGGRRQKRPYDPALCAAITTVREKAPVYGYRKTWARLRALGWPVNKKCVLRYARHLRLLQPRKIKGRKVYPAGVDAAVGLECVPGRGSNAGVVRGSDWVFIRGHRRL
jgi:hypothetical protein